MKRNNRKCIMVCLLLSALIGLTLWRLSYEVQQAKKDQHLIDAVARMQNERILKLLAEGANGEAREIYRPPVPDESLIQRLRRLLHPGPPPDDHSEYLPALLIYRKSLHLTVSDHSTDAHPEVVRALLDHGAQVNDQDAEGHTALWYASYESNSEMVRLLLTHGARVEVVDTNGRTPLMTANPDSEVTKLLLEHGANIEAKDDMQLTPLIYAVYGANVDVVRILLEHGAKVSPKNSFGETALDCLKRVKGDPTGQIEALLRKYGAK